MKVAIISAIFLGFAATQNVVNWDAKTRYCALANETAACGDLGSSACCGSITTKVGSAAQTSVNRCITRNLAEDIPSYSYTLGTVTTTVAYACLSTTRPSNYEVYAKCLNETTCASGYCCANLTYTPQQTGLTARNLTQNQCVPGSVGKDAGTLSQFRFGNTASNLGDVNVQGVCYAALNANFYTVTQSSAVYIKGAFAMIIAAFLALVY